MDAELVPDEIFDDDYLYFYETFLTDAYSDAEVASLARLIDLEPGCRVLDAPCGHGRVARRLAERGARVVGVDRSALFLDRARSDAAERGLDIHYRQGDLRDLPVDDGAVDVAVNWYTSFGYFDDAGNARVLEEFRRVLRTGGLLCIDVMNPAAVIRTVSSRSRTLPDVTWRGDDHLVDETTVDLVRGIFHTRHVVTRNGTTRHLQYSLRFHLPTELARLLDDAGFGECRFVGDDGGPLHVTSNRMTALARRR